MMFAICLTKGKEILLMVNTNDPDDGSILRDERRTDSASPFLLNHPKVWDEESEDETTAVHPAVSESEPTLAYGNVTSRYIPALNQYVTTWFLSYDIIPIVCPRAWKGFGWETVVLSNLFYVQMNFCCALWTLVLFWHRYAWVQSSINTIQFFFPWWETGNHTQKSYAKVLHGLLLSVIFSNWVTLQKKKLS